MYIYIYMVILTTICTIAIKKIRIYCKLFIAASLKKILCNLHEYGDNTDTGRSKGI
jgi:hypothetical protein